MKNSALVIVDMLYDFIDGSLACQNADNAVRETLKFIDSKTGGQGGEEHEILDTICQKAKEADPTYACVIQVDHDFSGLIQP